MTMYSPSLSIVLISGYFSKILSMHGSSTRFFALRLVGLDTSHAVVFSKAFNKPDHDEHVTYEPVVRKS